MAYRYRCGECGFRTSWTTRSEAEDRAVAHCTDRHPGLLPGSGFEVNTRNPRAVGCLLMLAVLFLLLIAPSCRG